MKKWSESDRLLQAIRQAYAQKKAAKHQVQISPRRKRIHSRELKFLRRLSKKFPKYKGSVEIEFKVPPIFSVIDSPVETFNFIASVACALDGSRVSVITLDHSRLRKHDLAAEILLGLAVKEVKKVAFGKNQKLIIRGKYPRSERQTRLIRSMGVVKKLKIESGDEVRDLNRIEIFDFKGLKDLKSSAGSIDRKNKCAQLFVDHINTCLMHARRKLNSDSVQDLLNFVGEIISNCEDHSGEFEWYLCGYLDDDEETNVEEDRFCEIVIFNFGRSIAETFLNLNPKSYAWSLVNPYIKHHYSNRNFGRNWYKDDLLTLVALQSHISSKNDGVKHLDRGQGTVDLIEFFQKVARECADKKENAALMALVSGKTHILFDYKYQIKGDENGREIIAFNSSNDLNEKPDPKYVVHLNGARFPGTLIGIRFPLKFSQTEVVTPQAEGSNE